MYLTLEQVKQHLNISNDFTEDDEYILGLIDVAKSVVEVHCNATLKQLADEHNGIIPPPIIQAALLYIGSLYQNREIVANTKVTTLPFNYEYLINLYIHY